MAELEDIEPEESPGRRRHKERPRKKRKKTPRDKKIANALYEIKWALAALLIGIPLLAAIFYVIG